MTAGSVIITAVFAVLFLGIAMLAILSFRSTEMASARQTPPTGRKFRVRTGAAPPRGLRRRKQDRVALLPVGATVSFGAERQAAGIDEVLEALDNDLVGLVPVKKKVQEIAALLLVDGARRRFGLD